MNLVSAPRIAANPIPLLDPRRQGLRRLHHSHVGGVFETEEEITALLEELGPEVIGFGLTRATFAGPGSEPAPFIERYSDRIGGMHITDVFGDHLGPNGHSEHLTYAELTATSASGANPASESSTSTPS